MRCFTTAIKKSSQSTPSPKKFHHMAMNISTKNLIFALPLSFCANGHIHTPKPHATLSAIATCALYEHCAV